MSAIEIKQVEYHGWPDCYQLSNGQVELIISSDFGPRILYFALPGQQNILKQYPEMRGVIGKDEFMMYGGHRLWHAPENIPRTYHPDNQPLEIEQQVNWLVAQAPIESTTGIQKEIQVELDASAAHATITHRLTNHNLWQVELAPWAITVMAEGGKAIVPLPPKGRHADNLLPTGQITLWAYTSMADPRWHWGHQYVMLRQDGSVDGPQKAGFDVPFGWAGYVRNRQLFVKKFDYQAGAIYPDRGCQVETFTKDDMLEVETLGPLVTLAPGESVLHTEQWFLFGDVATPEDDSEVQTNVLPHVQSTSPAN
jgi:hypothetical protein